ncbi:hypothetical protein BLNAU_10960 [Blattamonas nauphoetae]|uniref:Uncharacterized protein n=1 Tax=Blattamonas nauphoetae TaxID=2049346 RepID=A0ABQ9XP29_9EUKA|nr:hypothetical protein BLNAU_10960 [Blattamonas nauphoetae]
MVSSAGTIVILSRQSPSLDGRPTLLLLRHRSRTLALLQLLRNGRQCVDRSGDWLGGLVWDDGNRLPK